MAEAPPALPPRPSATSGGPNSVQASAIRQRLTARQLSRRDMRSPPPALSRRSSILSYSSFEDLSSSFADDIVSPTSGLGRRKPVLRDAEFTYWHSTPLAFAILPAIAGLLFNNGSAFVTDVLLLGLAAVFMNWSIRIPRDWYHSAQAVEREPEAELSSIPEELEVDLKAVDSSSDGSPKQKVEDTKTAEPQSSGSPKQADEELQRQELFALTSSFIMPAIAAYLLHVIRAQLSRPSTGLVSDYNLCIFLLAAEFWPCRQVARLLTARTLHLQRAATGLDDPYAAMSAERSIISSLTARVVDLETRLSDHAIIPPTMTMAQKADVTDLSAEMRKRYEPRLEGLERAVRRYEKRSATLTMVTDQRLQSLEQRLQDALSLAAVAAQHSKNHNTFPSKLIAAITTLVTLPAHVAWTLCLWPFQLLEELYARVKGILLGPVPARNTKRNSRRPSLNDGTDERARDKAGTRKSVR
jgi:hypothetical protein